MNANHWTTFKIILDRKHSEDTTTNQFLIKIEFLIAYNDTQFITNW